MRWLGGCLRANEIATNYANRRMAFGKALVDHEGVGFMLADNRIDLKQAELMVYWCADVLDSGAQGTTESSMAKVAVSEALMRVADRCVQCMGGQGVTADTIVEQIFREVRAFRIYDGPTEVHKWSLRVPRQSSANGNGSRTHDGDATTAAAKWRTCMSPRARHLPPLSLAPDGGVHCGLRPSERVMPDSHQAASFAKAITRDEFGRFYWDERQQSEVARSLAKAMARVKEERRARAKLLAKAKK
jgi:hypothetical protein